MIFLHFFFLGVWCVRQNDCPFKSCFFFVQVAVEAGDARSFGLMKLGLLCNSIKSGFTYNGNFIEFAANLLGFPPNYILQHLLIIFIYLYITSTQSSLALNNKNSCNDYNNDNYKNHNSYKECPQFVTWTRRMVTWHYNKR